MDGFTDPADISVDLDFGFRPFSIFDVSWFPVMATAGVFGGSSPAFVAKIKRSLFGRGSPKNFLLNR